MADFRWINERIDEEVKEANSLKQSGWDRMTEQVVCRIQAA
jgi:hypothetical protein